MPSSLIRCVGVAAVLTATLSGEAAGQVPRALSVPPGGGIPSGSDYPGEARGWGQERLGRADLPPSLPVVESGKTFSTGGHIVIQPRQDGTGRDANMVIAGNVPGPTVAAATVFSRRLSARGHSAGATIQSSTARTFVPSLWLNL